jgi:hypothetical protein
MDWRCGSDHVRRLHSRACRAAVGWFEAAARASEIGGAASRSAELCATGGAALVA